MEAPAEGLGFWPQESFKVIYSPEDENLNTHITINEDGEAACLCDEAICFKTTADFDYGHKLLGMPFFEEVHEAAPEYISLLQIDEDERWNLRFYDCGMLNFLIRKEDLPRPELPCRPGNNRGRRRNTAFPYAEEGFPHHIRQSRPALSDR